MKIWAHRGCSQNYPENTITAFEKAMAIPGLEGIELDVQLSRDGELVVIHDERVDRTTDGIGYVRDFSMRELKLLHIHTGREQAEHIPALKEVLELLYGGVHNKIRLNIELKNGVYPYPGMEALLLDEVNRYDCAGQVIYSSFYAASLERVRRIDPAAELGVLDRRVSDCLYKARGLFADGGEDIALHPAGGGLDIPASGLSGRCVRAWFGGHLYPEKPTGGRMDFDKLAAAGVTDVFINEPEKYLV